jgi:hypothetical protein
MLLILYIILTQLKMVRLLLKREGTVLGLMGSRALGLSSWPLGLMGSRAHGLSGSRAHGLSGSWALGHLSSWALELLGT